MLAIHVKKSKIHDCKRTKTSKRAKQADYRESFHLESSQSDAAYRALRPTKPASCWEAHNHLGCLEGLGKPYQPGQDILVPSSIDSIESVINLSMPLTLPPHATHFSTPDPFFLPFLLSSLHLRKPEIIPPNSLRNKQSPSFDKIFLGITSPGSLVSLVSGSFFTCWPALAEEIKDHGGEALAEGGDVTGQFCCRGFGGVGGW